MMHALLLSLALSQTVYEWIDSKGESHFTDDVSTIPKGAKRRTTEGTAPVVETKSTPSKPATAKPVVAAPAPDKCAAAQARVADVERRLGAARATAAQAAQQKDATSCQALLRTHGQPAYAQCMMKQSEPAAPSAIPALEQELEQAKEALRRTQIDGC
jgi:Domain of unknown function (DUF4124)